MKRPFYLAALACLSVVAGRTTVRAEEAAPPRKTLVTLDVPLAVPISTPLRDRFGLGAMPSLAAAFPIEPRILLGFRLRCGFLWNGPAPSDPGMKDPGTGGLGALFVTGRVRPLAKNGGSLALGPWLEIGIGPGITGKLLRAAGEAGLGWNFGVAGLAVGPTARYLRVVDSSDQLGGSDAQILLFGVEVAIRDPGSHKETEDSASPPAAEPAKVQDRDGDGIPDDVDKCPDEPEDKDGFEDEDGCPDPDNDGDGIPDAQDACPNEPETVNGFKDDDGCPDEGPVVIRKDRIYLKEHVLFDTNRARIKTESRPALSAIVQLWTQHPEWDHLIVDGHADRHGPEAYNLKLSHLRAERARSALIQMGFPPDKLTLRAFGQRAPRVPEQSEEADRENRRVEFVIVKKVKVPAAAEAAAETASRVKAAADAQARASQEPEPSQPDEGEPSEATQGIEPPAQAGAPIEPPSLAEPVETQP